MELLPNLLPIGGASAVFVYLLSVLVRRESQFTKERAELIAEHRAERAESQARFDKTLTDLEGWNQRLRTRVEDLERQVDQWRARVDDCQRQIDELRRER